MFVGLKSFSVFKRTHCWSRETQFNCQNTFQVAVHMKLQIMPSSTSDLPTHRHIQHPITQIQTLQYSILVKQCLYSLAYRQPRDLSVKYELRTFNTITIFCKCYLNWVVSKFHTHYNGASDPTLLSGNTRLKMVGLGRRSMFKHSLFAYISNEAFLLKWITRYCTGLRLHEVLIPVFLCWSKNRCY